MAKIVRYDRTILVNVLVHHAQTRTSGCFCGGVGLGRSYPEHIADVYESFVSEVDRG